MRTRIEVFQTARSAYLFIIAGMILSACQPGYAVAKASAPRETSPVATASDEQTTAEDQRAFGFELYHKLGKPTENVVFSPYSVSMAFAMLYPGARATTAAEIASALHFSLPPDKLGASLNALDLGLAASSKNGTDNSQNYQLSVANGLWGQKNTAWRSEYLDHLARNYGAGIEQVDFVNSAPGARDAINNWVKDQTKGKINDLFPPGAITSDTRMVLANAIYFYAAWSNPFPPEGTHDGAFHRLDGSTRTAKMMSETTSAGYVESGDFQAVSLPYQGGRLAMLLIMPSEGSFAQFDSTLGGTQFAGILAGLATQRLVIVLPRFTIESGFSLIDSFKAMGLSAAFDPYLADFTGIADASSDERLFIGAIQHKAYIKVAEAGTEAAAATGIEMSGAAGGQQPPKVVTFDHPFVYAIYDQQTGTVLFLGRVTDPQE